MCMYICRVLYSVFKIEIGNVFEIDDLLLKYYLIKELRSACAYVMLIRCIRR